MRKPLKYKPMLTFIQRRNGVLSNMRAIACLDGHGCLSCSISLFQNMFKLNNLLQQKSWIRVGWFNQLGSSIKSTAHLKMPQLVIYKEIMLLPKNQAVVQIKGNGERTGCRNRMVSYRHYFISMYKYSMSSTRNSLPSMSKQSMSDHYHQILCSIGRNFPEEEDG